MINKNYTILHCHTMLSNGVTNIDSVTSYKDYITKAKSCNMKSIAFSEHGNVFGWYNKKKEVENNGLKYIHAQEFYITETLEEKIRDNFHCLLISRNYEGVLELNKLSTKSFNREDNSYYYVPRISFDDLLNTSDNIIISTACLGGILNKGHKDIKNKFFKFIIKNKHRCFLELQPHISQDQVKYNQMLNSLSEKYNVECVMCTDTHALNDNHVKGRSILQKSKNIYFDGEDEFDLTFKTYDELVECCRKQNAIPMRDYLKAIDNTNKIADMVEEFQLDYSFKYPKLWGDNSEEVLRQKIKDGLKTRHILEKDNLQEYLDRIEEEMKAYIHNGAIDFILLMEDVASFCRAKGIGIGYGRGSVNGSLIAYLLHITEMDSIVHKLNFERFMSVARISLSDVDTDIPPSRVNEVKDYLFSKQGLYCSDIITFNTIALKGAIRDVGRALNYDLSLVGEICSQVEVNEDSLRDKYKELFEYVDLIQGTIVSVGSHPCALITSPHSIDDNMGLFTTATSKYPISQINMKEVDSQNYVKLDLLKLDTVEIINETCKLANIPRTTPDNLDIFDDKVWKSIRDDTTQIFQWEGTTGERYIKKILSDETVEKFKQVVGDVDKMTLFSIGNGAIRPAGANYRDELGNGIIRKSGNDKIDEFLKPTFGQLIFQEQILEFLHIYCGFTMGEADVVRRQFAKKTGTETSIPVIKHGGYLTDKKDHYIKGFIQIMKEKYDMGKDEAERVVAYFIEVIELASSYLFSLNHSTPYSYLGYASGWLRYYYPLEFLTVSLNMNKDKEDKTENLISYAIRNGIKISNPKFGKSKGGYFMDKDTKTIYRGIGSIKDLNSNSGDFLYDLDFKGDNFIDLLKIVPKKILNSKQLNILINLGYFSYFGSTSYLKYCVEVYNKYITKKTIKKDALTEYELKCIQDVDKKETDKQFSKVDMEHFVNNLISNQEFRKDNNIDLIKNEIQILSYTNLTDPNTPSDYYIIEDIKVNNYGTPICKIYNIHTGTQEIVEVEKKWYIQNPLQKADIIQVIFTTKPRYRLATEQELLMTPKPKWIRTFGDKSFVETGEFKKVLKMYSKKG